MKHEILMPKLGLTMKSGIVSSIKKKVYDKVIKGEIVAEFETDKITGEIAAPCDGYVSQLLCAEGDTVAVLKPVIMLVDELSEVVSVAASGEEAAAGNDLPFTELTDRPSSEDRRALPRSGEWILATPMARRLAEDLGASIENVQSKREMLVSEDVRRFADSAPRATHLARATADRLKVELNSIDTNGDRICRQDVEKAYADNPVKKMSNMRKTIARRLSESKQTIPHVYFRKEIDVTEMLEFTKKLDRDALGVKISLNDVILKVVAVVLSDMPEMRAQTDGSNVITCPTNIGMAVSVEDGLVVPVIENAAKKSLKAIAKQTKELAAKARRKQLLPDEMGSGCFTVSNLGTYGVDEFYAIINPPESAILAVGAVRTVPKYVSGSFVPRDVMTMCLSADHRLIDGALAADFLNRLSIAIAKIQTYIL